MTSESRIHPGDLVRLYDGLDPEKHPGWMKYQDQQGLVIDQSFPVLVWSKEEHISWNVMWDDNKFLTVPDGLLHIISSCNKENP